MRGEVDVCRAQTRNQILRLRALEPGTQRVRRRLAHIRNLQKRFFRRVHQRVERSEMACQDLCRLYADLPDAEGAQKARKIIFPALVDGSFQIVRRFLPEPRQRRQLLKV